MFRQINQLDEMCPILKPLSQDDDLFQTHPTAFPGQAPNDCPRDESKVGRNYKNMSFTRKQAG